MARNLTLKSVPVNFVIDGINVIFAHVLEEALFGPDWWKGDIKARMAATNAWMKKRGAHYYAEEKWILDDDGGIAGLGFSVNKGVSQAKKFGARVVVVENLS